MFPYDISSYAINAQEDDGLIFNFLSSRNVVLSSAAGWVEIPPSGPVTATVFLNDTPVAGASVSITNTGTVSITAPFPMTLVPGDHLQIRMNVGASAVDPKATGVAITFFGEEQLETDEDEGYDISFFVQGRLPSGRRIAAAPVVRNFTLLDDDVYVERGTEATILPITFVIEKNLSQVGILTLNTNGRVGFFINNGGEPFQPGDVFSILAPGVAEGFVDETLADLSITFKGQINAAP